MTTTIGAVHTRPINTPSTQRPTDDSQASFAQLFAPLTLLSGPPSPAAPLAAPAAGNTSAAQKPDAAKPAKEKSARSAQDLTSDAAVTVAAAASQRLFEGRGAEKPNEVNIAGRAAAELASHGEPIAADQPATAATASRAAASRQTGARPDAAPDAMQPRAAATGDSAQADLTTNAPIAANPAAAASATAVPHPASTASASQAAPVQGISPTSARPTGAAAAATSSAPVPGSAVSNAARSTGADAQNHRHDHSSAAAARTRMWARLERLGQRPPTPANAAATRSTDRAAGPDSTIQAQLARGLAAALRQRDGHVTLRLNPENLGNIRVDLSVQADRITASIAAADEQARRLLSSDVVALRTALEASGLNVERIEVVEAPAEPSPRSPTPIASHTPTTDPGTGSFDDPSRHPSHRDHASAHSPSHSGLASGGDASSGLALDGALPPSPDLTEPSDLYVLRIDLIA